MTGALFEGKSGKGGGESGISERVAENNFVHECIAVDFRQLGTDDQI